MRKLTFMSLFFLMTFSLKCQDYFVVAKLSQGSGGANNTAINQIFSNYGVYEYEQINECIYSNWYEISLTGNVFDFQVELQNSGYYYDVQIYPVLISGSCENCGVVREKVEALDSDSDYPIEVINAECAWSITKGDPNIKIAIYEFGFQAHDDLIGQMDFVNDGNGSTHGPQVSGMALAVADDAYLRGVAHDCKGIGVSFRNSFQNHICDLMGSGQEAVVVNASHYNYGANDPTEWASGNCPPPTPFPGSNWSGLIEPVEKLVIDNEIPLVVIAGNEEKNYSYCAIGDIPGVILVTGTSLQNGEQTYYNGTTRNQWVDIGAPSGEKHPDPIPTTPNPKGINTLKDGGITPDWGTSFGAPLVSGTIGLMASINNCLKPGAYEEILKETSTPYPSATLAQYGGTIGAGMLNTFDAVRGADGDFDPITEDVTWRFDRYLGCDLFVENGATLTIDGATIYIDEDVIIDIEQNANLRLLNGAKLTSTNPIDEPMYCIGEGEPWGGIVVHGDHTPGQSTNQSFVYISGSSTLENANKAILLEGGAKLSSYGTNFINNNISVEFTGYNLYSNASELRTNTFEVKENYHWDSHDSHVKLCNVRGVKFKGCTFENLHSSMPYDNRGYGIRTINAYFIVDSKVSGPPFSIPLPKSKFRGFRYGIYGSNTNASLYPFVVDNAVFNNNNYGIVNSAVPQMRVTNCDFKTSSLTADPLSPTVPMIGLYLASASGYTVTNNNFEHDIEGIINGEKNIGAFILNSGTEANRIAGNSFEGLENACLATLENRHPVNQHETGLDFLCNEYIGNITDIMAYDLFGGFFGQGNQGIRRDQGEDLKYSADNCFNTSTSTNFEYSSLGETLNYFHRSGCLEPQTVSFGVNLEDQFTVPGLCHLYPGDPGDPDDPDDPCESNYENPNCLSHFINLTDQRSQEWNNYLNAIDAGNTNMLMSSINIDPVPSITNQLNTISPYLSPEVLNALLDEKDVRFPSATVKDILTLNPEMIGRKELFNKIFEGTSWTQDELTELQAALNNKSSRSTVLKSIGDLDNQITNIRRNSIEYYLKQEPINFSAINNLLEIDNKFQNELSLIKSKIQAGNFSGGMSTLNSIAIQDYLEYNNIEEFEDISTVLNIELGYTNNGFIDYWNFTQDEIITLIEVSTRDYGLGGIHAMNILNYFYDEQIHPWNNFLPDNDQSDSPQNRRSNKLIQNTASIVYPNPAKEEITIKLMEFEGNCDIKLFNSFGRIVFENTVNSGDQSTIVNGLNQPHGIYYLKVRDANGKEKTEKILLIK